MRPAATAVEFSRFPEQMATATSMIKVVALELTEAEINETNAVQAAHPVSEACESADEKYEPEYAIDATLCLRAGVADKWFEPEPLKVLYEDQTSKPAEEGPAFSMRTLAKMSDDLSSQGFRSEANRSGPESALNTKLGMSYRGRSRAFPRVDG
jgi:hypothetical protein